MFAGGFERNRKLFATKLVAATLASTKVAAKAFQTRVTLFFIDHFQRHVFEPKMLETSWNVRFNFLVFRDKTWKCLPENIFKSARYVSRQVHISAFAFSM